MDDSPLCIHVHVWKLEKLLIKKLSCNETYKDLRMCLGDTKTTARGDFINLSYTQHLNTGTIFILNEKHSENKERGL